MTMFWKYLDTSARKQYKQLQCVQRYSQYIEMKQKSPIIYKP